MKLVHILFTVFAIVNASSKIERYDELIDHHFNPDIVKTCEINEVCVRFCCKNQTLCSEGEFFDLKHFSAAQNLSSEFKVLKGKPNCDNFTLAIEWVFLEVS